ncbi:hypothetical protein INT44_002190 [Umbelopsis vinacea]|uniref:Heme peroxidase n=1 Tax=Umbelopsis vinacea TaxID=44442 RepID=A0A8H7Q2T0_9FUNG|nr:hypothetical protein INT44_002190 [Umbelopsis vinacea]
MGVTPKTNAVIKESLGLTFKQKEVLISAMVKRYADRNEPTDDRENLFENIIETLSELKPGNQDLIDFITKPLVLDFYADIPKPYRSYVGQNYRSADGSGNSVVLPDTGKAGTNYARTVTSFAHTSEKLPDPNLVFDKLFKRPANYFDPHPAGINMLLFCVAILITHDLFKSDPKNPARNLTTSYLDLSPLYGNNEQEQKSIRTMSKGLLKADQWVDRRLVFQPAGVGALLVVFSRNHNFIAKKLLELNENGRFTVGPGLLNEEQQDEALFQTARLINGGCYLNIIRRDYIRVILGADAGSTFNFDPFVDVEEPLYGNAVSIEFNFVYRWHAAIGQVDSDWLTEVMALYDKASAESRKTGNPVDMNKVGQEFNELFIHATPEELSLGNPIAGLHRDSAGDFSQDGLSQILHTKYEQVASRIGNGLNIPASLKHIEVAGIMQGRKLQCCTFNEFRAKLQLKKLESFKDFSDLPEVQNGLKELYGTPDAVELYPGLTVEKMKPAGMHMPYTMGRAILSDAVNLLRNDRFFVTENTPANLTNWGYDYTQGDPNKSQRVSPDLFRNILPGAFSETELDNLFTAPLKP